MESLQTYHYPIAFRDVYYTALLYKADSSAIEQQLTATGFKPALFFMGSPLVALGLIQYKDSDLGAYNEIIISIPVVALNCNQSALMNWLDLYAPFTKRKGGQYIIHIPVTTQRSVDAGVQCWGYPKIVLPIEHHFNQTQIISTLQASDSTTLMQASGKLGIGIPMPSMNLMTYSFLEGRLVKTTVDVDAAMKWHPFADVRVSLSGSTHPMIQDLKHLGIEGRKPVMAMSAPHFSALFNAPSEIG